MFGRLFVSRVQCAGSFTQARNGLADFFDVDGWMEGCFFRSVLTSCLFPLYNRKHFLFGFRNFLLITRYFKAGGELHTL